MDLEDKQYQASRYRKNPERWWREAIKHKYGITADEYMALLRKQKHRCAICRGHKSKWKRRLHVDHCHKTGKVRGLLCYSCNGFLGKYEKLKSKADVYLWT